MKRKRCATKGTWPDGLASLPPSQPLRDLDLLPAQLHELANQRALAVQLHHLVRAAEAHAVHQDVGHRPPARLALKRVLQRLALRVLVELDDVRGGRDVVLVEEQGLCALGVGAVGLGEDGDGGFFEDGGEGPLGAG